MKSFEQLGDMRLDEAAKEPPALPIGSYLVGITSPAENITSTQKQTPGWKYHIKFYQPREDVDREALAAVMAEREMSITDFEMDDIFYITDGSAYLHAQFLQNVLGLSGMSVKQAVAEASGKQYIVTLRRRPFPRPDGTMGLRTEIGSRARAS